MDKRLTWDDVSPKELGVYDPERPYLDAEILDTGILGGWLTEDDYDKVIDALNYLNAIGSTYGMEALEDLLRYGGPVNDDGTQLGIDDILGEGATNAILDAVNKLNNPDIEPVDDIVADTIMNEPDEPLTEEEKKQIKELDDLIHSDTDTNTKVEDVNGDGDTDVATADTNGNGEKDTAVVTADTKPEEKEAVKTAKKELGVNKKDKTSTGKTKGELEDKKDVVSDEKKKDMTCSDATQKNIMAALLDHRY